jgi:DNA-binding CsgD family transcriptional regulator
MALRGECACSPRVTADLFRELRRRRGAAGDQPPTEPLTRRETEVLRHVSHGRSNKEVARALDLSVATVKNHLHAIYAKLRVNRRSQAVDRILSHCSAECIGIHAALHGTRFEALEPVRQGVKGRFGAIGEVVAAGLALRHDHASPYMAHDFQNEIRWLGIASSPAFVRAPEGNGCAERFIRTLQENLLWVRTFETVEELRLALLEFQTTYKSTG